MTPRNDKQDGLTLSPEFEKLIDQAVKNALKEHVKQDPNLSKRLTEAVVAGIIASCIWAAASQYPTQTSQTDIVVAQTQAEVSHNDAEAKK